MQKKEVAFLSTVYSPKWKSIKNVAKENGCDLIPETTRNILFQPGPQAAGGEAEREGRELDAPKAKGETFQKGVVNKVKVSIEMCQEKSAADRTI